MDKKTYQTKDLFLASYLVSQGHKISSITKEANIRKCTFSLEYQDDTDTRVLEYFNNQPVNVRDFKNAMEALRAMIREKTTTKKSGMSWENYSNYDDVAAPPTK